MSDASKDSPPTFDALPLSAEVRRAVDALGYVTPTPVQTAVFEPAVRGQSLVVQARTGTGKTAAFGLPLVDQLVRKGAPGVQALILTPTRELALQVARELMNLGQFKGIHVTAIYGGASITKQIDELKAGAQIVSGTPGRVLDHLRRGTLDPSNIRMFVLDEADEMLSMGFAKELNAIVELLPKERQGLFFSATIPPDIERMAHRQLKDPQFITLSSDQVGALEIQHFVYITPAGDKRNALLRVIEVEDPESAIVFCNTKDETERLAEVLKRAGYDAEWLNGDLEQKERERIMQATREGKLRFLVATDVAARGIDISHLTHVINADFPESAENYVHRTGRTGRAGRTGTAISMIGPKDIGALYLMRLTYKIRPIEKQLPSAQEIKTRGEQDLVQMFVDAFGKTEPHPDDLALARRVLTHDASERILAGLLRDHLGARQALLGESPAQQASEARRAKNPPPVVDAPPSTSPSRVEEKRPTRGAALAAEERRRDGRAESPATSNAEPAAKRGRGRRGGVPHASFATWEPREEKDDDQPILVTAESARPAEGAAPPAAPSAPGAAARPAGPPAGGGGPPPPTPGGENDPNYAQIFLNVGRRDGARPSDLQRILSDRGGISPEDTGRIRIRDRIAFVAVKKELLERAVTALAGQSVGGRKIVAEPARERRDDSA